MEEKLREWAARRGYRVAWYDGEVVTRAFDRIGRLEAEGALDAGFFSKFLSWTAEPAVRRAAETKSLVLVALPSPAHVVTFEDGGGRRDLVLPPTYLRYYPLFEEVLADLAAFTGGRLKLRRLSAPLKTIAGLTGFARYGKNNITYVEGLGSGVQLAAFAAEAALAGGPPPGDGVPKMLDECRTCRACLRACPMGAIDGERFLLHGERCLTGFTEYEGELPGEFGRLRTRTLIGCLACQDRCPANRGRLRFERFPHVFSSEETAYLLGERGDGPPAPDLAAQVRALGCTDLTVSEAGPGAIFRRNLLAALRT
jgi:epoxyqueuosine reductase